MPSPQDQHPGLPGSARTANKLQLVGSDGAVLHRRAISVLYVEDDDEDVFLLRRQIGVLPSFEVDFAHAPTVEAARAMTARHRFDVVLCDFWLGSETTIPLIDELKLAASPCPVVLVSSLDNDDIELIGRRAGAAGFVAKADLSAAALDRIFVTLLPQEERDGSRPQSGVATWLRALMRSIDAVQAAGGKGSVRPMGRDAASGERDLAEAVLADIVGNTDELRDEVIETLIGLERATRLGAWSVSRFDAVPYLADAVAALGQRAVPEAVSFVEPVMPIMIEASPTLFGDLVQGFFAEAVPALADGVRLDVAPSVRNGSLTIEIIASHCRPSAQASLADRSIDRRTETAAARTAAAADARRLLVETLARAIGGSIEFAEPRLNDAGPHMLARFAVPLRGGE